MGGMFKVVDKIIGHQIFQYSFECRPITTAFRKAIFCMYILIIIRKLVSIEVCHQSYFEVTGVFIPAHVF